MLFFVTLLVLYKYLFNFIQPNVQSAIKGVCPALFLDFLSKEDAENYIEGIVTFFHFYFKY